MNDLRLYAKVDDVRFVDADTGETVDRIVVPLDTVSEDLADTRAVISVSGGAAVVTSMEPAGDPVFRAMPNAGIEVALRDAFRSIAALGMGGGFYSDAEGRRIQAEHLILYPPTMHEMRPPALKDEGRTRRLIAAACAVIAMTVVLVASGMADPFVLLLVPGVTMWAWTIRREMRNRALVISVAPSYNEHVRRADRQSRSIAAAASRARGLTN